eukprot:CAMPEP_0195071146 /NCGR_PEP_ID=MMETSP0448-20130528/15026_1 /TAXON_ID=66468 /ORGANISM="Heterocapsa triquestra, Strain CCMP 448" /LENGTH=98 /DNA_ID=CAMNT_0040102943 /DNA_START=68 /DNA_END=360 /DNA_ORIENTATION=-
MSACSAAECAAEPAPRAGAPAKQADSALIWPGRRLAAALPATPEAAPSQPSPGMGSATPRFALVRAPKLQRCPSTSNLAELVDSVKLRSALAGAPKPT